MKEINEGSAPVRQVTKMGDITISSSDFSLPEDGHFAIKNDNEDPVTLQIKPYNNTGSGWVETVFQPGWNPEICKAVKQQANVSNIKWGC